MSTYGEFADRGTARADELGRLSEVDGTGGGQLGGRSRPQARDAPQSESRFTTYRDCRVVRQALSTNDARGNSWYAILAQAQHLLQHSRPLARSVPTIVCYRLISRGLSAHPTWSSSFQKLDTLCFPTSQSDAIDPDFPSASA